MAIAPLNSNPTATKQAATNLIIGHDLCRLLGGQARPAAGDFRSPSRGADPLSRKTGKEVARQKPRAPPHPTGQRRGAQIPTVKHFSKIPSVRQTRGGCATLLLMLFCHVLFGFRGGIGERGERRNSWLDSLHLMHGAEAAAGHRLCDCVMPRLTGYNRARSVENQGILGRAIRL